jgi:hypothetical protein
MAVESTADGLDDVQAGEPEATSLDQWRRPQTQRGHAVIRVWALPSLQQPASIARGRVLGAKFSTAIGGRPSSTPVTSTGEALGGGLPEPVAGVELRD